MMHEDVVDGTATCNHSYWLMSTAHMCRDGCSHRAAFNRLRDQERRHDRKSKHAGVESSWHREPSAVSPRARH
jgi:hypothetical protein